MYESFYKLTSEPFRLNPDPRFYFKSQSHERALAYLTYGMNQGEGIVVITGDVGSGKTTLAQKLTSKVDRARYHVASLAGAQLEPFDMLRMVAMGFDLNCQNDNKALLLTRLSSFFHASAQRGLRPVLLVDEAQVLSVEALEELRLLTNIGVNQKSALQIIFLGQPQFNEVLARPELAQLAERVTASVELGRLSEEDTQGYIVHRLQIAGWANDPAFTNATYRKIFALTRGLPRQINKLCARLLLAGYMDELHAIEAELVEKIYADFRNEPNSGFNYGRPSNGAAAQVEPGSGRPGTGLDVRLKKLEEDVRDQERLLKQALGLILQHLKNGDAEPRDD